MRYVIAKYGIGADVIFDGYAGPDAKADNIAKAGESFLLAWSGASAFNTLYDFRVVSFKKKTTNRVFQMARIPPTSAAAHVGYTAKFRNGWKTILNHKNGDGFN